MKENLKPIKIALMILSTIAVLFIAGFIGTFLIVINRLKSSL